ncbi:MAG: T9SS type A sorting domain-containing protein [Ignavibacteria bacterium]|nr:T9SS type A sorting domain-containing protein [Ignavibacteria bacterium]
MKKSFLLFSLVFLVITTLHAQSPIITTNMATFNAYAGTTPDTAMPYYKDLGVRRVIVADADNDGTQEIISTDYSNGGRVHVMKYDGKGNLEIVWSSPLSKTASGSTPRFPQVGDCDGDGMPEIIFEQNGEARIALYEWDGTSWGTEPAFAITSDMLIAAGGSGIIQFNREVLTVKDIDGDGRSEIIPHSVGNSRRDVYILGVADQFPGFASLVIEGGLPGASLNGINWATGSFWCATPADIDGDGKYEIINQHWDNYGMWAIQVNGPDSYTYPDTSKPGFYNKYTPADGNSYFGLAAVDVNGDGRDEISGTLYNNGFDMCLFQFSPTDISANLFYKDADSVANRYGIIATKTDLAALGGKTAAEFWPCVKGDLNKDGKEEIYTGGGRGINVIAVQYKGTGSLLDKNNYTSNLVYAGEGGDVFATINIYHGKIDTIITPDSTYLVLDPSVIDTVFEETPFTAYIFADSVDIDKDGNMEMVLSEQSVYDSTKVVEYVWADSSKTWERDNAAEHKIVNTYRKTVRVLEYTGPDGLVDEGYNIITPDDYKLENNYPNPFNPSTMIKVSLPLQKKISLKIFDMLGREVATLINNEIREKGDFEVVWNGTNNSGSKVASGNYIAQLTYGAFSKSIKMTLLK